MQEKALRAVVVGAGTMGTTLAKLMAVNGVKVTVVIPIRKCWRPAVSV